MEIKKARNLHGGALILEKRAFGYENPRRPACHSLLLLILIVLLIASAASESQEQDQDHEQERRGKTATFSATPLSLPRGNGFRHPSHPYALVSPNGRSANPTPAFCVRRFGHRVRHGRQIAGDDSPPREEGARVEINGGRRKDARVETCQRREAKRAASKSFSDSKDAVVEVEAGPAQSRPGRD